jgi:hypothetical protein
MHVPNLRNLGFCLRQKRVSLCFWQKHKDGTPIYTFYLAMALTDAEDEQHWNWKLRPEVSNAIKALGLDA